MSMTHTMNDKAANVKSKYTNLFEGVWDVVEWGSEIVWGLVKGLCRWFI